MELRWADRWVGSRWTGEWLDKHKVCWRSSAQVGRATSRLGHRGHGSRGPQCDSPQGPGAQNPVCPYLPDPHQRHLQSPRYIQPRLPSAQPEARVTTSTPIPHTSIPESGRQEAQAGRHGHHSPRSTGRDTRRRRGCWERAQSWPGGVREPGTPPPALHHGGNQAAGHL